MTNLFSRSLSGSRSALLLLACILVAGCSSSAERAQRFYDHGMELLAQHDNAKARIEFQNALGLKKDLLPAWKGLAKVDELDHRWAELVPVLRTIVQLDPKDVDSKLQLGRLMLYGGATDEALKLVNGIEGADNNANVPALKAAILYKLKDSAGAVAQAQAALKIDPNKIDAKMVLAADQLANGNAQAALQILDSDAMNDQKDLGVELFKIKIFEKLGDFPQIEAVLQKLIKLYPQESTFRRQLVKFYIDQHRLNDAETQLRAIVATDANNSQAELDLVRFLYTTQNPAAARAELTNRINAGGEVFPYQMALAEFDFGQGNFDDSYKRLQELTSNSKTSDQVLAAKLKLAGFYLARKNTDGAESIVSDILQQDSRNTNALRLRAVIRMDRNQLEPAISDLRSALNDQPRSTDLMLLLATAYERSGSIELAEKEFADATRVSNFDPNVGLGFVAFLRRRGSVQRAEDVLEDLTNRQPNNLNVLAALAEVKLSLQDWSGAQEIGEKIKRAGTNAGVANQILGAAYGGEQKYDASIAAFQSAVVAAPDAVQPMVALVRELVSAKQTDKATSFLQGVLKANPSNAEALVLMGSIALASPTPDQAIGYFKAAIEKQPKDGVGYRALSDLYLRQKNPDAAIGVIQAGLKVQPDNIALHMSLAGMFELKGNYDGAIAEYQYVLTQQPGSLVAANNLASLLADHRTDKASLEQAQSLATSLRKSQVPQFKDTLGWVTYRQGDSKSAVPLLEQAVTALPDVALIHYHLGMAYAAAGQNSKAADEFKAALSKGANGDLGETVKNELKKTATQ